MVLVCTFYVVVVLLVVLLSWRAPPSRVSVGGVSLTLYGTVVPVLLLPYVRLLLRTVQKETNGCRLVPLVGERADVLHILCA